MPADRITNKKAHQHHCGTCNKGFSRRRDLLRHMRSTKAHNNIDDNEVSGHECPVCGKIFTRADIRKKHLGNQSCLDRFFQILRDAGIPIPFFTATTATFDAATAPVHLDHDAHITTVDDASPTPFDSVIPTTFDYDDSPATLDDASSPATFDYPTPASFNYTSPATFDHPTPNTSSDYPTPAVFDYATPIATATAPMTPVTELNDDDMTLFDTYTQL